MKRMLSAALVVMMLAACLCVNASASVVESIVYENDFEDATGKTIVPETEGSENNVVYLAKIADDSETADVDESYATADSNGWIDNVVDFDNGFAVEARIKNIDSDGMALFFEAYNGDSVDKHSRGYVIPCTGLKVNTWYNLRLVFKDYGNVKAVINEVGTEEYLSIGAAKGTLSGNSYKYTPEGSETVVEIKNYYNRARFICHVSYGNPDGSKNQSATEYGWMVDDVKVKSLTSVASTGIAFEQDYEDATNIAHAGVAYAPGRDGGTAASYYAKENTIVGNVTYTLDAETQYLGDNAVLSFDIKKLAPSGVFNVHAGTGTKLIKMGIPANQLREDVWYTYMAVMKNGNMSYWRKAEDATEWTELEYSYNGEGLETLSEGQTTDVEVPITISGATTNGNSNTTILRMAIMYATVDAKTPYSYNTRFGSDFGDENVVGSHYLIDNYKLAGLGALEGIFADGTAEMRTFSTPEDQTFVASYDASGRMLDVDFTSEIGTFDRLALTTSGAESVWAYVWSADNAPVSSWDVTAQYTAE